jgi:DNA-binding CsgD family transcriptional regulator
VLNAIQQDPVLSGVKLIAEPWDLGPHGHNTGAFAPPFAEWNDRYRDAVRDALVGDFHCPPRIAAALVRRVNAAGELQGRAAPFEALTPREEEIARLLECAMTNKAIAARLGIGTETVRNHVYRICRKLDAHRRTEIAPRLRERGPELRVIRGRRPQEE